MTERIAPPEQGVYENIPFDEYLLWDCFSKSMVKPMLRSGQHLLQYMEDGVDSKAIRIGSLVDCLVFEPELFEKQYVQAPEAFISEAKKDAGVTKPWDYRSPTCRKWRDDHEASGMIVVTADQYFNATKMRDNVLAHPEASQMLKDGEKQVSIVWTDPITGELCKARFDNLRRGIAIDDLKTTNDASKSAFQRTMNNFLYHVQGAAYSDGWSHASGEPSLPFNFIAVESDAPYQVATYNLGIDSILTGRYLWNQALAEYSACRASGKWPGYSPYLEDIDIPPYAIMQDLPEEVING